MTDASFASRMNEAQVRDLGAARRKAYAAFQRAMLGRPADKRQWTLGQRLATVCLVGYVTVLLLLVEAVAHRWFQ